MKILALIPARGGSKRLPGKNLRTLRNKPLIVWTIDAVSGVEGICDVLVSTDDSAIADAARNAGASVPWLRPSELATDTASSVDVALHALGRYERENASVDGLLLLQPTSPFRTRATIERGIAAFRQYGGRPVVGVTPAHPHPSWCFRLEGDRMTPFVADGGLQIRSQDLPPAYAVNGAFYLIRPADLRSRNTFFDEDIVPLIIDDPRENVDIDTAWDWTIAEVIAANG